MKNCERDISTGWLATRRQGPTTVTSTGARIGERTNLEFFLLLTFNIGTTTNQYDEELARMLGKKVIFLPRD